MFSRVYEKKGEVMLGVQGELMGLLPALSIIRYMTCQRDG